ncbi:hypothetical protein BN946_scf184575.g13 [Trametes cinnabarina]|uniref:Uncharacterized protein n=1 Tax=Pycnoporus cinnabarinus TaxID=5643 RepID=A0A060SAI1_PYCCI|nr:hypothetical protein BN946_scf184575.g13 [Trametes cinnabarina]
MSPAQSESPRSLNPACLLTVMASLPAHTPSQPPVLVTNIPSPAPEEAPLDQPAVNLDCEDMWEDDDESAYWAVYEDAENMDLIDGN